MPIFALGIERELDGRLQVFAGTDDQSIFGQTVSLHRILQQSPGGDWPATWDDTFGIHGLFTTGINSDGRLEVVVEAYGEAHDYWELAPNSNKWSGSGTSLGGTELRRVVLGRNADGRLELFVLGGDRGIWHKWQTSPNGSWGEWHNLGGTDLQQILAANNADGRLEVFALGGDKVAWHKWQTSPNGGWGEWDSLGGTDLHLLAAANEADGRLILVAVGGNSALYYRRQVVPNGSWADWRNLAPNPFVPPQPIPPDPPTGVTASGGNAQATVSWSAPAFNGGSSINQYLVDAYLAANGAWQLESVQGNVSSTVVSSLKNGSAYYFEVKAQNSAGIGLASARSNVVTPQGQVPQGIGAVALFNCKDNQHTLHIWTRDLTAGSAWQEEGTITSQWDNGSCPAAGSTPLVVNLQAAHQYLIAAVDPESLNCGGENDPTNINCIPWNQNFLGLPGGPTFPVTIA
jgi:hypothetical protein